MPSVRSCACFSALLAVACGAAPTRVVDQHDRYALAGAADAGQLELRKDGSFRLTLGAQDSDGRWEVLGHWFSWNDHDDVRLVVDSRVHQPTQLHTGSRWPDRALAEATFLVDRMQPGAVLLVDFAGATFRLVPAIQAVPCGSSPGVPRGF